MRACNTDIKRTIRDQPQYLAAFHQRRTLPAVIDQFAMIVRDRRCIYDQVRVRRNKAYVFFVVDGDPFAHQLTSQLRLRPVIPRDVLPMKGEIPGQRAHSNDSDADKIYRPYVFKLHHCRIVLNISPAMRSPASVMASRPILSLSVRRRLVSCDKARTVGTKIFFASPSLTMRPAFLLTRFCAFTVWWSSAAWGKGTKTTGFATTHNSAMDMAPEREITTSAAAKAYSICGMKSAVQMSARPALISAARAAKGLPVCQISWVPALANSSKFAAMASLMPLAPSEPPVDKMMGRAGSRPKNLAPSSWLTLLFAIALRTGLPVTRMRPAGKKADIRSLATKMRVAFFPNKTLLLPAKELLSWMKVGIPFACADRNTGKLE